MNFPIDFPVTKLKWVATTTAGGTPSVSEPQFWADDDEGLAWVSIGDMSGRASVTTTGRRVTEEGIAATRLPVGAPGTLLLSMYASLGHTAFLSTEASWNQAILGINVSPSHEVRFVKYALDAIKPTLAELARSNTQANLNAEQVGNLVLPSPSLEEQRRIVDFLDAEIARSDKISALQWSALRKLDERESAQLDSGIDELVKRHGVVPLRRFLLGVDQGASPQCEAVPAAEDEWGVLKVSCLRPGLFVPAENKRLPVEIEPDLVSEVREGDLLIVRANTPQLVGSTAVVPKVRRRLLLSDKIFRVRLDSRLTADFVATVARGRRIRALCAAGSNGASQSMANIRFEEVKAWPIPAVELGAQADFVAKVANGRAVLDKLRPRIERQLALFAERRQALITAAVTGQFDVSTASGRNVTEGITA